MELGDCGVLLARLLDFFELQVVCTDSLFSLWWPQFRQTVPERGAISFLPWFWHFLAMCPSNLCTRAEVLDYFLFNHARSCDFQQFLYPQKSPRKINGGMSCVCLLVGSKLESFYLGSWALETNGRFHQPIV